MIDDPNPDAGTGGTKRGRGRPPVGPTLTGVSVPEAMLAELDALAARDGLKRSELVRDLLGEALAARRAGADTFAAGRETGYTEGFSAGRTSGHAEGLQDAARRAHRLANDLEADAKT